MSSTQNGLNVEGRMTLMDAAFLVERLQARAAHEGELQALRIARDALLVLVSEGYSTLGQRLNGDAEVATTPAVS